MKNIFPLLLMLSLLTSCVYHLGNPALSAEMKRLSIAEILNQTQESSLTALFKNALAERIGNEPGLCLASGNSSDDAAQLYLHIKTLDNHSLARAKLRDKKETDYEGDAYQTVLYRVSAKVAYEVYSASTPEKLLRKGEVSGQADLPKLHDREIALRAALRQLAIDLAANLVVDLSEKEP